MNFTNWNKDTYEKYINYLISIKDIQFKEFHSKLTITKYPILGVKIPFLRKIAKEISKTNFIDFLNLNTHTYYEEILIEGLVISNIKDEETFNKYFNEYIKYIDNWAICDTFSSSLNIMNNKQYYFDKLISLSLSNEEFISRVGLVTILFHFIEKDKLTIIFNTLNKITNKSYYTEMAIAWLICEIYTKYPEETINFLKNNNLDKFTQNKAISKIRDSFRISKQEKDYISTLKK